VAVGNTFSFHKYVYVCVCVVYKYIIFSVHTWKTMFYCVLTRSVKKLSPRVSLKSVAYHTVKAIGVQRIRFWFFLFWFLAGYQPTRNGFALYVHSRNVNLFFRISRDVFIIFREDVPYVYIIL